MRVATPIELRGIPLFSGLTADELAAIARVSIVKDYPKGTVLFFEGMQSNVLHVVLKGRVEIFKKKLDGTEISLNEMRQGEFLGEVSLADAQPRSASARAADDAVLLVVTKDQFEKLIDGDSTAACKLLLHFCKALAGRLRRAEQRTFGPSL